MRRTNGQRIGENGGLNIGGEGITPFYRHCRCVAFSQCLEMCEWSVEYLGEWRRQWRTDGRSGPGGETKPISPFSREEDGQKAHRKFGAHIDNNEEKVKKKEYSGPKRTSSSRWSSVGRRRMTMPLLLVSLSLPFYQQWEKIDNVLQQNRSRMSNFHLFSSQSTYINSSSSLFSFHFIA